jgi:hypothetical protein
MTRSRAHVCDCIKLYMSYGLYSSDDLYDPCCDPPTGFPYLPP